MYGTLRDYKFSDQASDIRGATLYGANDDKLGKISDVIFDQNSGRIQHVIVDTGGWLSSNKFLVPADRLTAYPREEGGFSVNLSRQQIEKFPTFNEDIISSEEKFRQYETQYHTYWPETSRRPERLSRFEENLWRNRENISQQSGVSPQGVRSSRERKVG